MTAPSAGTVLRVQARQGRGRRARAARPRRWSSARPGRWSSGRSSSRSSSAGWRRAWRPTVRDENRPDGPTWTGRLARMAGWVARRRCVVIEPGELNDVRTVECVVAIDPSRDRPVSASGCASASAGRRGSDRPPRPSFRVLDGSRSLKAVGGPATISYVEPECGLLPPPKSRPAPPPSGREASRRSSRAGENLGPPRSLERRAPVGGPRDGRRSSSSTSTG